MRNTLADRAPPPALPAAAPLSGYPLPTGGGGAISPAAAATTQVGLSSRPCFPAGFWGDGEPAAYLTGAQRATLCLSPVQLPTTDADFSAADEAAALAAVVPLLAPGGAGAGALCHQPFITSRLAAAKELRRAADQIVTMSVE